MRVKSLLKYIQAKHSVTLGNWMTIIIMLIHLYIYVNNLSLPLVLLICSLYYKYDEKLRTYEI